MILINLEKSMLNAKYKSEIKKLAAYFMKFLDFFT